MHIGFIGLGNVGGKLAASLLRHRFALTVRDLDPAAEAPLVERGAVRGESPAAMARDCEVVITCLPSPAASAAALEAADGVLAGLTPGTLWVEMSTTDAEEVARLGARVRAAGGAFADAPVSGGCHRAASGNIAILVGAEREVFERLMPLLGAMGRRILHTGAPGSASVLKVLTNYLATANLVTLCEALTVAKAAGLDLATSYEAIRVSSGNSFVHETESQVILNGSRDIGFTMGLVLKDITLFQQVAERAGVALEINPRLIELFRDGIARYGGDERSPNIIRRLEDATGLAVLAEGFPERIVDEEPEESGREIVPRGR